MGVYGSSHFFLTSKSLLGKLMKPGEVPEIVRELMREVEQSCVERGKMQISSQIIMTSLGHSSSDTFVEFKWDSFASPLYDELVQCLQPEDQNFTAFFDCALCNHYPDGDAACKFHTDPEVSLLCFLCRFCDPF